jgi:ribosomal-protein-alanine N-acetyltransferase
VALRKALSDTPDVVPASRWRRGLPTLRADGITLRQLQIADAPSLLTHLNDPRVWRYIAPCPSTRTGFERFIRWTHSTRRTGKHICFGMVPDGERGAVGVIQIWPIEKDFSTAEWGFALGETFWGKSLFATGAELFIQAVFAELGVHRLEARVVDVNERAIRLFERLGARRDGVLRDGFRDGTCMRDHVMWSILAPEWHAQRRRTTA